MARNRTACALCALLAVPAGCAGSQTASPIPRDAGAMLSPPVDGGFARLYDFKGAHNGALPDGALVDIKGILYGTTSAGGVVEGSSCGGFGCGIVFKSTQSGSEQVLYRFKGGSDGSTPEGALAATSGAFYGTTTFGGNGCSCGTVFKVTEAGAERVIYSFKGYAQNDGGNPQYNETLLAYDGNLYGTTYAGGSANLGTVYEITPSGKERVLHAFGLKPKDGANPTGKLIAYGGVLYGAAFNGGTSNEGAIFAITTSGKERIVYSFPGNYGGAGPNGVTAVNGVFYGTTTFGGSGCYSLGCGLVFGITPAGKAKVLYRFQGGANDGSHPGSGATLVTVAHHAGILYGTTDEGGCPGGSPSGLCGTVFAVSTSGAENVLFEFQGFTNGFLPLTPLTSSGGMLYGTTYGGGATCPASGGSGGGCGTIFRIAP